MADRHRRLDLSPDRRALLRRLLQENAGDAGQGISVSAGDVHPASFGQERLWVLDRMRPGNPAYNIAAAHRLHGPLDVAALRRGLQEIVRRHEVLRAGIALQDGRPVQCVERDAELELVEEDSSGPDEALSRLGDEARRAFALERPPLLRAHLFRLGPERHLLSLVVHHVAADGWSLSVLNRELGALYDAFRHRRPSPLPDLPLQYGDYARWQRGRMSGELLESLLGFWRGRLTGAPMILELPADGLRPPRQSFRGQEHRLTVDEALRSRLVAYGRERGATLAMVLLAAFGVLLGRLTGQRDLVIGTPVAGRGRPELERLIGCFVNSLPLRLEISGDWTCEHLLARVRDVSLAAYDHQDLPFERLLDDLQPPRDLGRTPVFQVFFNHVNVPDQELGLAGLTVERVPLPSITSNFDLTLYVNQRGRGLELEAVSSADLYASERMQELLRQYHHLLEQSVAAPGRPIGRLSLVTAAARRMLPDPTVMLDPSWRGSVSALVANQAQRRPERAAVSGRWTWTHGELDDLSGRLAARLRAEGVGRGDVVAVSARRGPPLVLALMAILRAGAAFAILDPAYPAARLTEYLRQCRPRGWIGLGPAPAPVCPFRLELPDDGTAISAALAGLTPIDPVDVGPDDLAYVAFTSGSTGRPKGVLGRHGPLTHFLPDTWREFGLTAEDRFSLLSGLAHDPLHRDVFTPLPLGASVCCPEPGDIAPGRLPAWLRRARVTVTHLTPALGQVLTAPGPGVLPGCLPGLRRAFFVGDVLTRQDVARLQRLAPDVGVVNYYGSTETQRAVSAYLVPDQRGREPGDGEKEVLPLGRGIDGVQLLVLNGSGALAGVAEPGEIHVRSPHLARGYLGDDGLTAARFAPNPFTGQPDDRMYRTGDLGRYLPGGDVETAGRTDRQVKIRGHRVEPGEVEAVLRRHPAVREAVVRPRPGPAGEPRLVAYVVLAEETADGGLRQFLREQLPEPMVPAALVELSSLPLNPNGKVDEASLPDPAAGREDGREPAPLHGVAAMIAAAWSDVLGVRPRATDSFFDLGGNSLALIGVHARLVERLPRLAIADLFRHADLASLAADIERRLQPGGGAGDG